MMISLSAWSQKFNYTYNGVTITYEILSVSKHEVEVDYVPEYVTAVTVPAAVSFNGEYFRVVKVGDGGAREAGFFYVDESKGYYSFNKCNLLKTVELPNTIREIGSRAFEGCVWLRRINLPEGLQKIGSSAFRGCESLVTIKLPSTLKTIESYAFSECLSLRVLAIPSAVTFVGNYILEKTSCKVILPKNIGLVWNDVIIPNGSVIGRNVFSHRYQIVDADRFSNNVLSSPDYYLKETKGTAVASLVKKALLEDGQYEIVLSYYPNDAEVKALKKATEEKKRLAEANSHIEQGDNLFKGQLYAEAREQYEIAARLNPIDMSVRTKIEAVDDTLAEQERLRIETERKNRRWAEEKNVRILVDGKIGAAREGINHGQLETAATLLTQALDSANAHSYVYRKQEIENRIDSIRRAQALVSDSSRVFDYKIFRPDIYATTNQTLTRNLRSFLLDRGKRMDRTHLTFSLKNPGEGSFDFDESSRALKKFCKQQLSTVQLNPLIIDGRRLNGVADFDFAIEYASGKVKVRQDYREPTIDVRFDLSPDLEIDLEQRLESQLRTLPYDCDGKYTFAVTSMSINGQMEHTLELKSARFDNGPQNAWKSLLVPGWGDKYVEQDGKFDWWKTIFSYGLVGIGIPYILDDGMITITSTSPRQDQNINPVYPYYVFDENGYKIYDTIIVMPKRTLGYIFAACGAAIWIYDVIHVYIRGKKNKKENKACLRRLSLAYDPRYDAPGFVYTLNF